MMTMMTLHLTGTEWEKEREKGARDWEGEQSRVRSSHRANFRFKFKKADKLTSNDTRITPLSAPCMSALVCACLHLSAPIVVCGTLLQASRKHLIDTRNRFVDCQVATPKTFLCHFVEPGSTSEWECSSKHLLASLNSRCSALSFHFYDHCNVNTNPCQPQNPIGN